MSAVYFRSIFLELSQVNDAAWADQDENGIKQLKMDIDFLGLFCFCLETWKYSTDEENEESMERVRCVIFSLKRIWPKDFTLLSLLLQRMCTSETLLLGGWPNDFDSVMFELEGLITQSKQLLLGWCRYSLHSSTMQFKPSKYCQEKLILGSLKDIQERLILSLYGDGKIVPLIDILRAKIIFLNFVLFPDEKETTEFLNFIGHFTYSAVCLTFLCWGKEDNDETASEMDIVRFAMLHKFIPYAYHITPLFIGILKSDNPQALSSSFLLGEAVETFVDFFFDHLAIVLKDDFMFLRDRLMFLFTFLINPPCENTVQEEGDLIRSRIYAILHQDVYLLLSFDAMKEDFSDGKVLFSGFMNRIDIVNAKIRQHYRGSSDSWIIYGKCFSS